MERSTGAHRVLGKLIGNTGDPMRLQVALKDSFSARRGEFVRRPPATRVPSRDSSTSHGARGTAIDPFREQELHPERCLTLPKRAWRPVNSRNRVRSGGSEDSALA